jgi:hypothetical protein
MMVLVPYEVFFSTFALIKVVITQIWIPQNVPFYFKYFFKNCLKIKNFKFKKKNISNHKMQAFDLQQVRMLS